MILVTIINKDLHTLVPIIYEFKEQVKKHILIYDTSKIESKFAKRLSKGIKKIN